MESRQFRKKVFFQNLYIPKIFHTVFHDTMFTLYESWDVTEKLAKMNRWTFWWRKMTSKAMSVSIWMCKKKNFCDCTCVCYIMLIYFKVSEKYDENTIFPQENNTRTFLVTKLNSAISGIHVTFISARFPWKKVLL